MSSDYEKNIGQLIAEKRSKFDELSKDKTRNRLELASLQNELETLQSLYENYNLGMNVFRRAQGGRAGLRERE